LQTLGERGEVLLQGVDGEQQLRIGTTDGRNISADVLVGNNRSRT
jgi:hypothetical protein